MSSPRLVIASVLALLFVAVPRVLADVAPIAANRQISASGTYCFLPFCTVDASFSVGDSSQALGPYDESRAGSATTSQGATFSGSVQQTSNATSDAITLVMSGNSVAPAGFGPPGELVNGASSLFSLQFTLTDPSQVHIFGAADLFLQAPSACSRPSCFSGSGTQMVALTGPGVNFAPSIPVLTLNSPAGQSVQQHVPFGSTFELLPGQYDLEVSSVISGVASGDFVDSPNVSFDLSLTADFTSIVPEPSAAPFLLLSIAGLVWYRARGRADSRNFPLGRRNGDSTRSL